MLFTKFGCNAGTCHGSADGQNNFCLLGRRLVEPGVRFVTSPPGDNLRTIHDRKVFKLRTILFRMKNTKEGAEVVYTLHRADDNRIVKMHAKRKIRPHGDRGYIPMPKELIGKFVIVTFEEGAEKNVPSLGAMSMLLPCTQRRM